MQKELGSTAPRLVGMKPRGAVGDELWQRRRVKVGVAPLTRRRYIPTCPVREGRDVRDVSAGGGRVSQTPFLLDGRTRPREEPSSVTQAGRQGERRKGFKAM